MTVEEIRKDCDIYDWICISCGVGICKDCVEENELYTNKKGDKVFVCNECINK